MSDRPGSRSSAGAGGTIGPRSGALLMAVPPAIAADAGILVILLRLLHADRAVSIPLAFALTIVVWGLAARILGSLASRRGTTQR